MAKSIPEDVRLVMKRKLIALVANGLTEGQALVNSEIIELNPNQSAMSTRTLRGWKDRDRIFDQAMAQAAIEGAPKCRRQGGHSIQKIAEHAGLMWQGTVAHEVGDIPRKTIDYSDRDWLSVIGMGDIHDGAGNVEDAMALDLTVQYAHQRRSSIIGMGDMLECVGVPEASRLPGTIAEQKYRLQEQIQSVKHHMALVRSQIDVVIPGNHDYRPWYQYGIMPLDDIVEWVNVVRRTQKNKKRGLCENFGARGVITYLVGKKKLPYSFFIWHGKTGATTAAGTVNALERESKVVHDAHVYLMGHAHRKLFFEDEPYKARRMSPADQATHKRVYICCGHFLWDPGYTQRHGLQPLPIGGIPEIILRGDQWGIKVLLEA